MQPNKNVTSSVGVTVNLSSASKTHTAPANPVLTPESLTHQTTQADDDSDDDLSDLVDDTPECPSESLSNKADDEPEQDTDLDKQQVDNGVLEIYKAKCLGCGHLAPHLEQKFNKCHFTKGNDQCPASSVQILIGIPLDNIVRAFLVAEQTGDNARLGRLYAQLAQKPEWQQQRITGALAQQRADSKSQKSK